MIKLPLHQDLPTLEDVARRRGQTVVDLLREWRIDDDATLVNVLRREGVAIPAVSPFERTAEPRNAIVTLSRGKRRNSKFTLDAADDREESPQVPTVEVEEPRTAG